MSLGGQEPVHDPPICSLISASHSGACASSSCPSLSLSAPPTISPSLLLPTLSLSPSPSPCSGLLCPAEIGPCTAQNCTPPPEKHSTGHHRSSPPQLQPPSPTLSSYRGKIQTTSPLFLWGSTSQICWSFMDLVCLNDVEMEFLWIQFVQMMLKWNFMDLVYLNDD